LPSGPGQFRPAGGEHRFASTGADPGAGDAPTGVDRST